MATDDFSDIKIEAEVADPERPVTAFTMTAEESTMLPIWPSGIARFADGILEVTTGGDVRVAASAIVEIDVDPPRAGRLSLRLAYRAGLSTHRTSYWVEPEHEAALHRLVEAVQR